MDDMEAFGGMKRPHEDGLGDDDYLSENEHQTSKSRGTVTVQIFIKKTYKMINDCDPKIASWTAEGDKFVIKDPEMFAQQVIPQYFDHNKFSSFTRQLNFYKFTREQSKAIKKSDNSSEIAKHQTFYHKYFQRGRPDLLKHLQRSRKTNVHDDDVHPHSQGAKKPKLATSSGDDKGLLEQMSDLVRRVTESEMTIKNLQQENATLSFAVQKLQKQDEMKQRALVALQEQIRMSEINVTQSLQQQQSQLLQFTQPLPFDRESSLSGVNASTLMRFLSIDPKLQMSVDAKLQRLTTPPFRNLTSASQGAAFSAAAAAQNLVETATENAAARSSSPTIGRHPLMKGGSAAAASALAAGASSIPRHPLMKGAGATADALASSGAAAAAGGGATLPRHSKFKSSSAAAESAAAAVAAAAGMDSGAGGASLPRHANFKSSSADTPAAAAAPGAASLGGGGATLSRHPKMRRSVDPSGAAPGPTSAAGTMAMLSQNGFLDNKTSALEQAMRNGMDDKAGAGGNDDKREALASLQQQMLAGNAGRGGGGSISPSPAGSALGAGFGGGASQLPGSLAASLQNNLSSAAALRGAMAGGLGQGTDFASLAKDPALAALRLGAAGGLQLERELSNIGGDLVTREESFTLASLLDLSKSSSQPI